MFHILALLSNYIFVVDKSVKKGKKYKIFTHVCKSYARKWFELKITMLQNGLSLILSCYKMVRT